MSLPLARRAHLFVEPGDLAPPLNGVGADGAFYSLDAQAGRPATLLIVDDLAPAELAGWLALLSEHEASLAALDCDLRLLIDMQSRHANLHTANAFAGPKAVFCEREALARWGGEAPFLVLIDRSSRIAAVCQGEPAEAIATALAAAGALPREAVRADPLPAPVLVIPNVLSPDFCRQLVAHFEASPYEQGGMASRDANGRAYHKIDEAKKKRFDFVLGPKDPMISGALNGIIRRCIPEIRKAFNVNVAHTDRLLVARYDVGGHFLRHRDNSAPGVEFRQFALSVNLNDDYEDGAITFPEYNSRRYRPPAGSGVVFSCSLLHEATPVTSGSRYVLLTFLHDAAAQARWMASTKAAMA
jgi:predicted 2-oxoglutarate/Fe(II)-dependent dioxygenase YbiX